MFNGSPTVDVVCSSWSTWLLRVGSTMLFIGQVLSYTNTNKLFLLFTLYALFQNLPVLYTTVITNDLKYFEYRVRYFVYFAAAMIVAHINTLWVMCLVTAIAALLLHASPYELMMHGYNAGNSGNTGAASASVAAADAVAIDVESAPVEVQPQEEHVQVQEQEQEVSVAVMV